MLPLHPNYFLDFIVDHKFQKSGKLTSFSTLGGYRSALSNLYRQKKIIHPQEYQEEISEFFGGLKRTHADEKQSGECSVKEGKSPLSFRG